MILGFKEVTLRACQESQYKLRVRTPYKRALFQRHTSRASQQDSSYYSSRANAAIDPAAKKTCRDREPVEANTGPIVASKCSVGRPYTSQAGPSPEVSL